MTPLQQRHVAEYTASRLYILAQVSEIPYRCPTSE